MTNQQQDVTIYSTPTCGYCEKAKEFFAENGIQYTDHDVSSDETKREEMVEKSGQMGVPFIIVGDELIVGFDEDTLRAELNL